MARFMQLILIVVLVVASTMATRPALAEDGVLATPEAAVTAYLEGVARQDFQSVLAASAAAQMSAKFDFAAYVDRLGALLPTTPTPANSPFLIEINKAGLTAQIARQVQFLTYGLMVKSPLLEMKTVRMDAIAAAEFQAAIGQNDFPASSLSRSAVQTPQC